MDCHVKISLKNIENWRFGNTFLVFLLQNQGLPQIKVTTNLEYDAGIDWKLNSGLNQSNGQEKYLNLCNINWKSYFLFLTTFYKVIYYGVAETQYFFPTTKIGNTKLSTLWHKITIEAIYDILVLIYLGRHLVYVPVTDFRCVRY